MTRYTEFLASAYEWLRYERGCYLIAWERSPWGYAHHKPDVIGLNKERKCIELEIKRTVADFKHDAEKNIWAQRDLFKKAWPQQFYYFVEPAIVDKVLPLVREGFGLLTFQPEGSKPTVYGNRDLVVVKRASTQKDAKKLTVHQLLEMTRHSTGTSAALLSWVRERDRAGDLEAPEIREYIAKRTALPLGGGHDYTSANPDI